MSDTRLKSRYPDWLVKLYWRQFVLKERCPCSWRFKSKRLIRWCGRMDDAMDRIEFRRSVGFIMGLDFPLTMNTTAGSSTNVTVTYTGVPRKRHGETE